MINHRGTMAHLISLLLIMFEKTEERNKIGKWAWAYPYARELHSKDVEGHGTEAMAQPKSREHWLFGQPPGVVQTTTTASSSSHGHLHLYSNQLRLTSSYEAKFNLQMFKSKEKKKNGGKWKMKDNILCNTSTLRTFYFFIPTNGMLKSRTYYRTSSAKSTESWISLRW